MPSAGHGDKAIVAEAAVIVPYSTSAIVRVHTALNSWFREHGSSPSYREISCMANVPVARVRRYLDHLANQGTLTHRHHVPRSIVMIRRLANVSDDELHLECLGRNWTLIKPDAVAAVVAVTFPL